MYVLPGFTLLDMDQAEPENRDHTTTYSEQECLARIDSLTSGFDAAIYNNLTGVCTIVYTNYGIDVTYLRPDSHSNTFFATGGE